jgi:hypothetical protein
MSTSPKFDEEKGNGYSASPLGSSHQDDYGDVIIADRPKVLTKLNHFLSRLGGEERGIERVLPEDKTDQVPLPNPAIMTILTCVAPL